ncbi:MAG: hypothetical protein OEY16_07440, partial [Alphaproteobacteria bacterium]|nr:hypothetical protein [Alphaproteobacteria bacterium]
SGVLSWRKIIRSETHGLTLIAVVFAVLRLAMWWIGGGEYPVMWMGFAAVMLVLLTAVVVLKKTTKIFAPR